MPILDTTNLENLANLTFQDFVALHQQGQNRAHSYYLALRQEAQTAGLLHVENYATLAESVIDNDSVNRAMANYFTMAVAGDNSILFGSPGADGFAANDNAKTHERIPVRRVA